MTPTDDRRCGLLYLWALVVFAGSCLCVALYPAAPPDASPEPPRSPNAWAGDWLLVWRGPGLNDDFDMSLGKDGSYRAVGRKTGVSWTGTWAVYPVRDVKGQVLRDRVEFWVSESDRPRDGRSWLHWGVILTKKFPREAPISQGDCHGTRITLRPR